MNGVKVAYSFFFLALTILVLLTGCGHTYHLPRSAESESESSVVQLEVGERCQVMSEQMLSEFALLDLVPPAGLFRSSDPEVVRLDSKFNARTAWVLAVKPGIAKIDYYPYDQGENDKRTVVEVRE
jgi:hypothetical protein